MKIFLNDRTIEFLCVKPDVILPADLVTEYHSADGLKETWEEFRRYEKFKSLKIFDTACRPLNGKMIGSPAFKAFASLFHIIHAAGGLVKNENGDLLFIHRFGYWDLPKGKIDKKDRKSPSDENHDYHSACTAAIREVREETGLKSVMIMHELSPTWHIYFQKEKCILKNTRWFTMEADSGQRLKPQTSEGIFMVKWIKPKAIHCILSHTYASLRELLVDSIF